MQCPTCPSATLVMSERQGIEIDYCPSCRGVWLDRGELDKLIERATEAAPQRPQQPAQPAQPVRLVRPDFQDSDYRHGSQGYGAKRKKSWLNEIFD